MIKKCLYCGIQRENQGTKWKYCNKICYYRGVTFRKKVLECQWCGVGVEQKRARIKQYCNPTCKKEGMAHKVKERNRRYCNNCGGVYWIKPRSKRNRKFCSRKCAVYSRINMTAFHKRTSKNI